jgi:hypothetical protein
MLNVAAGGPPIEVPVGPIARELARNHSDWLPWLTPTLGSILMLAQEILIQQLSDAQRAQPIPQFLRHVRNGVGHNGRWEFRGNEPRYAATWRTFTLDATMHGQRVFEDINGDRLLGPGDPIRLLWDIEQAYPNLKV